MVISVLSTGVSVYLPSTEAIVTKTTVTSLTNWKALGFLVSVAMQTKLMNVTKILIVSEFKLQSKVFLWGYFCRAE